MALEGIWEMLGVAENLRKIESGSSKGCPSNKFYHRTRRSGMEFDSDWTKHRKSLTFTAQVISSSTSFIPWSSKIAISEGYHEI